MFGKRKNILLALSVLVALAAMVTPFIGLKIITPKFEAELISNEEYHSVVLVRQLASLYEDEGIFFASNRERIDRYVSSIIADRQLLKLRIFDSGGLVVFSTDPGDEGRYNDKGYFKSRVSKGNILSKLVKKGSKTLEGEMLDVDDVLETYVPVMINGEFMGAVEVYHNVSLHVGRLDKLARTVTITLTAAFLVISWALFVSFQKSRFVSEQLDATRSSLDKALRHIADEKAMTESIIEAIGDGISIQDRDFRIIYQNRKHIDIIGDHRGKYCYEAYEQVSEVCEGCPLELAMKDGMVHSAERSAKGGALHVEITASPLKDSGGSIVAGIESVRDITRRKQVELDLMEHRDSLSRQVSVKNETLEEYAIRALETGTRLKASLEEKEVLLREVHHRVKNNMQIISSLLALQSLSTDDEGAREALDKSVTRILSMALVHEKLYQSDNFTKIDLDQYVDDLAKIYETQGVTITREISGRPLNIDLAVPCGLIMNELISNSMKHAFNGGGGNITIGFKRGQDDDCVLSVKDDGVGIKDSAIADRGDGDETRGLLIVRLLVDQMEGKLEVVSDEGTEFNIHFKAK